MVLLKVDLACTFAARFARPDVLEVEAVHGSRMRASTEEFFSSMCTGVGDKTVSNEGEKTCRTVLLILVDEANMKKKDRDRNVSWKSLSFKWHFSLTIKKYLSPVANL